MRALTFIRLTIRHIDSLLATESDMEYRQRLVNAAYELRLREEVELKKGERINGNREC